MDNESVWRDYQTFTQAFNYARQYNDEQYALFRNGSIKEPHFMDIDEAKRRVRISEWKVAPMDARSIREALGDQF